MLQIYTPDLVPELTRSGGQAMAEGITSAGHSFGRAIQGALEEEKNLHKQGKAFETLLSTLPEDERPMPVEVFRNKSKRDQVAIGAGFLQAQGYQHAQAQIQDILAQAAGRKAAADNASRAPAFLQALGETGRRAADVPAPFNNDQFDRQTAPLDAQAIFSAAGRTGYNPGNQVDDLLRTLQTNTATGPPVIDTVDLPFGSKGAVLRGSKDLKTFTDPGKNIDAEEMIDSSGQVIGHRVPTGNGRFQFRPIPKAPDTTPQPLLHPGTGEPIPGWLNIGGKAVDVRTIMERAGLGQPGAAATPKAAQFKKGDKVKQNGIIYQYDGKDWKSVP